MRVVYNFGDILAIFLGALTAGELSRHGSSERLPARTLGAQ